MMGINTRSWAVSNAWPQRLAELGVPNIRTKVGQNTDFIAKIGPFLASGGKVNSTIVATDNVAILDKAEATKNLAFLKNNLCIQNLCGIEGPNEFNSNYKIAPNWAAVLRDFVQWTYSQVRADAAFNSVPVIGPSIWKRITADYQALGNISPWVDKGCIHFYSGRSRPTMSGPTKTMQGSIAEASSILAPGKPMWMTESGWQSPSGNNPISARAHAKYVIRDYLDAFGYGVQKMFTYQLMDNSDKLFGLCDANANPKPAFNALKNLVALVKDQSPSRGSLAYTISGAPTTLKSFSFSKSDGTYLLAFYLDVDSYDQRANIDLDVAVPVTVSLASPARKIEVYKPTFDSAVQTSGSGKDVPLFAMDQATVLKIWF